MVPPASGAIAATVWVDFDQNITLGDSGETFSLTQGPVGTYTGTITVPAGASLGNTRLRVRVGDIANLPCGQTTRGEVEDYTVAIAAALVALAPPVPLLRVAGVTAAASRVQPAALPFERRATRDRLRARTGRLEERMAAPARPAADRRDRGARCRCV